MSAEFNGASVRPPFGPAYPGGYSGAALSKMVQPPPFPFLIRQWSLQYFTSFQTRSHFLRQVKGRPHEAQTFSGK